MYQRIVTFSLIFLAAVAQVSLAPSLFFGAVPPDVVLLLIVIWSSRKGFEKFWLWALLAGLTLDIVALERFGIDAISFLVISFGVAFFSERFFVRQRSWTFLWVTSLVVAGTLINQIIIGLLGVIGPGSLASAFSLRIGAFKILNNLIVFALIYRPIVSLRSVFPAEESRLIVK